MIYGYARVSTIKQDEHGNSLEGQVQLLQENGAQEIVEEQFTGGTMDRPAFKELIQKLQSGDTLMVTKLDRLARTTKGGLDTVQNLIDRGVTVHVLNMGIIDKKPLNQLTLTMFLAFAEYERAMIKERTQEGKRIAKTRAGFKDGRPKLEDDKQKKIALNTALENIQNGVWSYRQASRETGISLSTIQRRINEQKKA